MNASMKAKAGIAVLLLELALLPGGLAAQEGTAMETGAREVEGPEPKAEGLQSAAEQAAVRKPRTQVQDQLTRLIRQENGIASTVPTAEENKPERIAEGTLELEPMIVEGKRELAWPPPVRENRVQEVLRTGTLWERVGSRFTKRFWAKGDRGIGFTLSW